MKGKNGIFWILIGSMGKELTWNSQVKELLSAFLFVW
jgi:hypothetical protein